LETEFEKAIVYEAHDEVYSEVLTLATHEAGPSALKLSVFKGRMSENMILRLILVCKQEAKEIVPGVVGPDEFIVF
jgi:hypothetical protein